LIDNLFEDLDVELGYKKDEAQQERKHLKMQTTKVAISSF
jgi:hypothetical protein